jgi:hypothetical protein
MRGSKRPGPENAAGLSERPDPGQLWPLIRPVYLETGRLRVALDRSKVAGRLGLQIDQLSPVSLAFEQPFKP